MTSDTRTIDRGGARHPLVELTLARVREFVREPEALFWAFLFPILMSIALAVAFPRSGGKPVVVAVAPGVAAEQLRRTLTASEGIVVREIATGGEERALREGDVHLVIVPTDPPTYRFDAAREESRVARLVVDDALKRAAGRVDPFTAAEQPVEIAGSRYVDWLIPGIVGMNIMGTSMWGIGFAIVQTRMRKLLKRLIASPMRRSEFLLGQIVGRLLLLAPEAGIPLAFGALVLGMPIRGSLWTVGVVSLVGALGFGGVALLLACRARTFEAISGMMNLAMLPMWLLSGVFFSSSNFPASVQPVIQALPLTALVNALRAVVLEGSGVAGVARDLAVLSLWGVGSFAVALRFFRWR